MKYIVNRKNKDLKLVNYNVDITGMKVKPINRVSGLTIKADKITLVDSYLRDSYISQIIDKKTDKIVKFIMEILNDEVSGEDDSGMVLDEINRLCDVQDERINEAKKVLAYEITKIVHGEEKAKAADVQRPGRPL